MDRWIGVAASHITAHPGLAAVTRALLTPGLPPDDASSRQAERMLMRLTGPETARPVEWTTYPPRDLARTTSRLSRDGPPGATFS